MQRNETKYLTTNFQSIFNQSLIIGIYLLLDIIFDIHII